MKNYAGQCGFDPPRYISAESRTSWGRRRATELRSYLDAEKRPYIHLLDGALADNIGMRSVLELAALVEDVEASFELLGVKKVRKLVFLMVSAETHPDVNQYKLDELPSLTRVLNALVDIPINRYSDDTFELMGQAVKLWRAQLRQRAQTGPSVFTPDADIYFINVSLSELEDPEEQAARHENSHESGADRSSTRRPTPGRVQAHPERQGLSTAATGLGDGSCQNSVDLAVGG